MAHTVLIVDDSQVARKLLIKSFPRGWEATVTQAKNGAEAASRLSEISPDIVFLDLNMPEMDGYQFLASIPEHTRPTIIVVSGDIQPVAQQRALSLGAKAFVKKPISSEAVRAALHACGVI